MVGAVKKATGANSPPHRLSNYESAMTEPLDLPRHPSIRVTELQGRGRGVVAIEPIRKGELIEASPVVRLLPDARPPKSSPLFERAY